MGRLNASLPIIAGKSLGGLSIGAIIDEEIRGYKYGDDYTVTEFVNDVDVQFDYSFFDGVISATTTAKHKISALFCKVPYSGTYLNKLRPGIAVGDFLLDYPKHLYIHGTIMVNGEYGAGYIVPDGYEDHDYLTQFDKDFVLEEMFVMPREWIGF